MSQKYIDALLNEIKALKNLIELYENRQLACDKLLKSYEELKESHQDIIKAMVYTNGGRFCVSDSSK